MSEQNKLDLTSIIGTAIKMPGVKVERETFLREQFKDYEKEKIELIVEKGPVEAGCTREEIKKLTDRIIKQRTAVSSGASFVAGLPGGWTMAVAIPADILQFYAVALRMAQEIVYLYGEKDLWCEGTLDTDKVTNQLILYCGVMLGATGASQAVRLMSSALAKEVLKKLPQKALTKTFYYPVIKAILKFFGVSITKKTFAKGISKAIPVIGGVISGGITLASMPPMGKRLQSALDKAHFDYSKSDIETDINEINKICEDEKEESQTEEYVEVTDYSVKQEDVFEEIKKAKQLMDEGIITESEFNEIKQRLISKM